MSGALYTGQTEENPYLGILWPTITMLLKKMNKLQFFGAILDGIQT